MSDFAYERKPTLLWREHEANQKSFGHALINEASPMFLVLQEHLGLKVPTQLQLLVMGWLDPVLHRVLAGTVASDVQRLSDRLASLPPAVVGICFRQLIVGDGGYYIQASRASLTNSTAPPMQNSMEKSRRFSAASTGGNLGDMH